MRRTWSKHWDPDSYRLLYLMNLANLRRCECLYLPRRPTNHRLLDVRLFPQSEMQAALILRPEAAATRDLLHLLLPIPEQPHLRANGATVADAAFQFKGDPLVVRRDGILVQQQRPFLVDDHDIQHATIPEIGERHSTAIVRVGDS